MIIGPIAQYHENSKYYSAVRPQANPAVDRRLPHITVEMPVYKESLEETMYVLVLFFLLFSWLLLLSFLAHSFWVWSSTSPSFLVHVSRCAPFSHALDHKHLGKAFGHILHFIPSHYAGTVPPPSSFHKSKRPTFDA